MDSVTGSENISHWNHTVEDFPAVNICVPDTNERMLAVVPQAIIMFVLSFVGCIGNLAILLAGCYLLFKGFRRRGYLILVLNLTVSDFLMSSLYQPFLLSSLVQRHSLQYNMVLCRVVALLKYCFGSVVIFSMMSLALHNYCLVCRCVHYDRVFSTKRVMAMVFLIWFTSVGIIMPSILEEYKVAYDVRYFSCHLDADAFIYPVVSGILFPYAAIIVSFVLIARAIHRQHRRLEPLDPRDLTPAEKAKRLRRVKENRKVVGGLVIIVASFTVCFIPTAIVVIFGGTSCNALPYTFHRIASIVSNCPPVINPLVYVVRNNQIIGRMKQLWHNVKRKKGPDVFRGNCRNTIRINVVPLEHSP
ncbi:melatonin receptor type 1A-like [Glandiceps talaboti]